MATPINVENQALRIYLGGGGIQAAEERNTYRARLVRAGRVKAWGNQPGRYLVEPEAIKAAVEKGLFDELAMFIDHAGFFDSPSLYNLAAVTQRAVWNADTQSADTDFNLYENDAGQIVREIFDAYLEQENPSPNVGISIVFWPKFAPRDNEDDPLRVVEFRYIESADFVFSPAADGRVLEKLSTLSFGGTTMPNPIPEPTTIISAPEEPTPEVLATQATAVEQALWLAAQRQATADSMIAAAGDLPVQMRTRLSEQTYDSPAQVAAAIARERELLAALQEDQVIDLPGQPPRENRLSGMRTGYEEFTQAFEALLAGTSPSEGVRPLSGIREAYLLLSGDYEMFGRFNPERVMFANVNSSTMAELTRNVLNKALVNEWARYPLWWQPFTYEDDFTSLQTVSWITLGGVGELPTVSEGAAYTELTWDDKRETQAFVKKGGYLGLTLEAMDKDDTRRVRAMPRVLAQGAWLTLGKTIAAIFTSAAGLGPTLGDSIALFNASHNNLGSTALSHAAWSATRTAMRKQTEVNSAERLGGLTTPKFLLVPPDLETTALEVLASDGKPGTANNDVNTFAEGEGRTARLAAARARVITVDLWTDTNNWAAVADPLMYPSIGIGYRFGRQPELFTVASPTAGLMFTNDTLPVKVRFFYAAGVIDYRGVYKHNVS